MSINSDVLFPQGGSVSAAVSLSIRIRTTLKITWPGWKFWKAEVTRAGLSFKGSMTYTLAASLSYSDGMQMKDKQNLFDKVCTLNCLSMLRTNKYTYDNPPNIYIYIYIYIFIRFSIIKLMYIYMYIYIYIYIYIYKLTNTTPNIYIRCGI